jgi:ATP-dependent DNA helicase RecG
MPTTTAQIDLWRQEPSESQILEFKEAKGGFDRERLAEYCVAIANEGGGHLLLGVADTPQPRPVVGSQAFQNPIDTANEIFQKVGFRVEIEAIAHPAGRVVVFTIPSRLKGTAYHLNGRYLMRSGSSLVSMSEDRLRGIFGEGAPDWLEEPSMRDIDAEEVVGRLDTQAFFELLKQPYPSDRAKVLVRLLEHRLIDQNGARYSVRRIAGLLLAKRLEEFPDLARKAPRVIVYTSTSKLDARIDQTGQLGYAVGFQGLVTFVVQQMPQNEVIENALRKKVKLLPENGVRELIANSLIHQDFKIGGAGPMIEIYPNRIVISNPGEPIVKVDRFIDGYQSRNERLADFMRRMSICEERGSGIDRVVHEAEVFQLPAPRFQSDAHRTMVTVYGPKTFEEMDRDDRVRACYQHCVLKWVLAEHMTNQSLRERFGLAESRAAIASQIIAATIEVGIIKPDDAVGTSRKYARYLPSWA